MTKKVLFYLFTCLFLFSTLKAQTNHIISVANFAFTPASITITVGDTVTWKWVNGTHTTTSDSTQGSNSWNSPISASSTSFSKVITSPGLHRFYCIPHGSPGGIGMSGTITANPRVTSVESRGKAFSYNLYQNYPNPFNPSTLIRFSVPENAYVVLKVFNALGSEVATLLNNNMSPGQYEVNFNGAGFTSGVYFVQMKAGSFVNIKKMILLK